MYTLLLMDTIYVAKPIMVVSVMNMYRLFSCHYSLHNNSKTTIYRTFTLYWVE